MYTVASFFSGIGGLDLGFKWAGFDVIWACDILETAVKTYNLNFENEAIHADINYLSIKDIPDADIFIGGPPCQSFSLVGKRLSDDPRGQLILKYREIIKTKRPKAFVIENVPGLAASKIDGKRLPEILKSDFENMGYKVTLAMLDATKYLVPQRRKRLFMIGSLESFVPVPNSEIFAAECYNIDINGFDISSNAAIGDLGTCTKQRMMANYVGQPSEFAKLMRRENGSEVFLHECPQMSETDRTLIKHIPPGGNYMDVPDELSTGRILKFKKTGGRTTTYGRLHPDFPAYTINTYFRRPNVGCNFHFSENRLITAREAMRFQSIPDHFDIWYKSKESRNTIIGNAVPPLLAQSVAWALKKTLDGQTNKEQLIHQATLF